VFTSMDLDEKLFRQAWQLTGLISRSRAPFTNSLVARGIEVHGVDCLLATYCLENGMALLTDPATAEPFVRHLGLRVPAA
jgi:hypothetical protein